MSQTVVTIPAPPAPPANSWPGVHWWAEKSGFSFHDLLDAINPLQHIPIIDTIYRAVTGDEPGAVSRIVGDGLFGGLFGLVAGLVDVIVQADTGKDIGEHVLATLGLDGGDDAPTQTASGAATAKPAATAQRAIPLSPARYILPKGPNPKTAEANSSAPADTSTVKPSTPPATTAASATPATISPALRGLPAGAPPTAVSAASLHQRPVPLQLTGVLLPHAPGVSPFAADPHPVGAPLAHNAPSNAPQKASLTAAHNAPGEILPADRRPDTTALMALPNTPPIDISQKMSDALDKYAQMMRQREAKQATGRTVNLAQ